MIDFTNSQRAPLVQQSRVVSGDALIIANQRAEVAYRDSYGKRPVHIHVQAVLESRNTPGYPIAPKRWEYYVRFPTNKTVFATVGEDVSLDGWLTHEEVVQNAIPGRDEGTYIINIKPHSMETFDTN